MKYLTLPPYDAAPKDAYSQRHCSRLMLLLLQTEMLLLYLHHYPPPAAHRERVEQLQQSAKKWKVRLQRSRIFRAIAKNKLAE